MGKKVSKKRKLAIRVIIGYVVLFCLVSFGGSFEQVDGKVLGITEDTLTGEASTGQEYTIYKDNQYTKSKKVGDSIDLKIKGEEVYDKVRGEGEELNERTVRTMLSIGTGVLGIITLLIIYGWPYGNEYTEVIYHVGEDDV